MKHVKSLHPNFQTPLFGDVNAAKSNKNTSKTLTFKQFQASFVQVLYTVFPIGTP